MANEHAGHRQRLKNRFAVSGLDDFEPHNILELLLFYAIPQRDTNPIAHRLMNRFGSFSAVLDARVEDLMEVEGMGRSSAEYLTMFSQVARKYLEDKAEIVNSATGTTDIGGLFLTKYVGVTDEQVMMATFDNKNKLINCKTIFKGDIVKSTVPKRKVVEEAIATKAARVVLAHNHPSGLLIPSPEDMATTMDIGDLLEQIDVELVDHIIVGHDDYVSMAASGYQLKRKY
ncbi:MAG: RadC family protein [Oscillospiraceae bacterium]